MTTEKIEEIMQQPKPNQKEHIKFSAERINKVLPKYIITEKQAEDFVIKCIEEHNQREEKRKEYVR